MRGVQKGVPPRLGESLRPAPRPTPAARCRAVSAAPTARRWNSPRPASSATRREPHQPLAHLLGAWPPAKALLDWCRGDKGGRGYSGPAPWAGLLKGVGGCAPLTAQRLGLAGEGPCDASTARRPRLASATMPRSFLVRKSACSRRRPNYSELHDSSPGERTETPVGAGLGGTLGARTCGKDEEPHVSQRSQRGEMRGEGEEPARGRWVRAVGGGLPEGDGLGVRAGLAAQQQRKPASED